MVQKIKDLWQNPTTAGQKRPSVKKSKTPKTPRLVLRGAPDDRGVLNVGGRVGAAYGPSAIRRLLRQFMVGIDGHLSDGRLEEGSDIAIAPTIEKTHDAFRRLLASDLRAGALPIALGGGHDYGFPHIAAAADVFGAQKIALINVDAHLDVRPLTNDKITSGSPYFLALESELISGAHFVEFGIQAHCNQKSHADYLAKKRVRILSLEECRAHQGVAAQFQKLLKAFAKKGLKIVVSIDIDAVQMSQAPGVSAPQADGFTAAELFALMRACAQ